MHRKNRVYIGFSTVHDFRHPLGIFEHIPSRYGRTTVCVCVCVCVCGVHMHICMLSHVQLFVTPWTVSPPGSSVQRISQARVLEAVAISSSRGAARPRDQTRISYVSCTGRQILYQLLYPTPNSNTAEVSWEDKGANITNKLFCTRSQQEPAKREGKREMDKQARREEWVNNMPKMLEDF